MGIPMKRRLTLPPQHQNHPPITSTKLASSPLRRMASSSTKFSYQRLRKLPPGPEEDEADGGELAVRRRGVRRSWLRLDGRARRWRRPRVRVAGLRRLLRRKAKVVGAAVRKVLKRLKEGRPYVGELFAGNYMFMQVGPSPTVAYLEKPYLASRHHAVIPPHNSTRLNIPRVVS